jgi:hypothetical protein
LYLGAPCPETNFSRLRYDPESSRSDKQHACLDDDEIPRFGIASDFARDSMARIGKRGESDAIHPFVQSLIFSIIHIGDETARRGRQSPSGLANQRSTASATPMPPPMHSVASPFFAPRRCIS